MSSPPRGVLKFSEMLGHLSDSYEAVTEDLLGFDASDYLRPSGCEGWTIAELLFHLLLDPQRALVTFATPDEAAPDVDYVTYWKPFRADSEGSIAHARYIRQATAAHSSPDHIFRQWRETSAAAVRLAGRIRDGSVRTQGHVLTTSDFIATLVVEASVHHLDLFDGVPRGGPPPGPMSIVRLTLNGLLGASPPSEWDDVTYALKATGRRPLDADDLQWLGAASERIPVFS